ncbi:MAG: hypothetical protein WCD76_19895 [Pyrinomonadaceae bacterium]
MQTMRAALPVIMGAVAILLGVLCLIFNERVGGWLKRYPLLLFGAKPLVDAEEIIFRGLASLLGLLYVGIGFMLLTNSLR